jgi:4-carboxymuconolactone decarboxylase
MSEYPGTRPRLHPLRPGELSAEQREVYDAITGGPRADGPQLFALTDAEGRLQGPFNAMLLSPPVGSALQSLGSAIRYGSRLPARVREIAVLAVAAHHGSAFERQAHEAVGRAVGLTQAELEALRRKESVPFDDPAERVALAAVRSLLVDGDVTDEVFAAVAEALGERGLFELTALVGYYSTLALQLRVFRAEPAG